MKKIFIFVLIMSLSISMIAAFSLSGCKGAATTSGAETTAAGAETTASAETTQGSNAEAKNITFNIFCVDGPEYGAAKTLIDEYCKANGISFNFSTAPYDTMAEKVTIALQGDAGSYDIIGAASEWFSPWVKTGFFIPLDKYGTLDSDFSKPLVDLFSIDKKLYEVPYFFNPQVMFYRTDIFEEKGLEMPTNLEDFYKVAKQLSVDTNNDGDIDIYGASVSGFPAPHLDSEFFQVLWSFGGVAFDSTGKAVFNSEIGLKALNWMITMTKEVSPPWFLESTESDQMTEFTTGTLATFVSYPYFTSIVSDPEKSSVSDKWGLAPYPGTLAVGGWGYGITSGCKYPEEAYKLIQYITTVDSLKRASIESGIASSRISVLNDPDVNAKWPYSSIYSEGLKNAQGWPPLMVPEWNELENIIFTELNMALAGEKTPEVALNDAVTKVNAITGK